MKREEMDNFVNNLREKIGEENAGIIADDLGTLLTDNANMLKQQEENQATINKLREDKENLLSANGNLLKQVSMQNDGGFEFKEKEEKKERFSIKDAFDTKGNFI